MEIDRNRFEKASLLAVCSFGLPLPKIDSSNINALIQVLTPLFQNKGCLGHQKSWEAGFSAWFVASTDGTGGGGRYVGTDV